MNNTSEQKTAAVVGMGYVGMSLAVMLAEKHHVRAVEIDPERVRKIRAGISPIRDSLLEEKLQAGNLDLTVEPDLETACEGADFVLLALPTNYDEETGRFDTAALDAVLMRLGELHSEAVPVIRSTIPVGYCEAMREKTGLQTLLFSPEFLRENSALSDQLQPSRIVIGAELSDPACCLAAESFQEFLLSVMDAECAERTPKILVSYGEAEAIKLFSNTYLAMRVTFFNELDSFAESSGLRASEIVKGVCSDPRVGEHYNNPSFGYGGYCLPKDTRQLAEQFRGISSALIPSISEGNRSRKQYLADRLTALSKEAGEDAVVGIYRLVMKKNSDNMRQSASADLLRLLKERGIPVLLYEPLLSGQDDFEGVSVEKDLAVFKERCRIIAANRMDDELFDVREKVYTRDLYGRE